MAAKRRKEAEAQLLRRMGGVQAHQLPEVLRMPLESLCLSVKTCLPHVASIQQALARLLSPPTEQAVAAAVKSLTVRRCQYMVLQPRSVPRPILDCLQATTPLPSHPILQRRADPDICACAQVLGALDDQEMLTPLGQHLSKMPMDIRLAKTLIYASMLR